MGEWEKLLYGFMLEEEVECPECNKKLLITLMVEKLPKEPSEWQEKMFELYGKDIATGNF